MTELSKKFENIILIPCSGSEYHGELARQVAIYLAEKSEISTVSSMTCSTIFLKNMLLGKEALVEITKNHLKHSLVVVINGCNTACASSIYNHLDVVTDLIISVQDIIPKQRLNLKDLNTFKNTPKLSHIKEQDINKIKDHVLSELEKLGLDLDSLNTD